MFGRVADYVAKVVSPISRILGNICMVVIVFVTLLVVADVFMRRVFEEPIHGSHDLTTLAFSIIVFLTLAWSTLKNRHIELDLITNRLPKTAQSILEVIMIFFTTGVLGVLSWQLLIFGTKLRNANSVSAILEIPMFPFVYLAAFGSLIVTLAFFIRLLNAINSLRRERQ